MSTAVRRAIYGRMSSDTTLNNLLAPAPAGYTRSIFYQQAPGDAEYPFVVFQKQSGVPSEAFADPSALETDVWLIKAVDKSTSADDAEAIQARIVTLMNDASLSISGATLWYLRRQSDVEYPEVSDGVTYVHAGSLYRLITS